MKKKNNKTQNKIKHANNKQTTLTKGYVWLSLGSLLKKSHQLSHLEKYDIAKKTVKPTHSLSRVKHKKTLHTIPYCTTTPLQRPSASNRDATKHVIPGSPLQLSNLRSSWYVCWCSSFFYICFHGCFLFIFDFTWKKKKVLKWGK